jgi:F0F1-type ATP synthase assembly protein I
MQRFKGVGPYGTVGLDMVLAVMVGLFGGMWLDHRLKTRGWLSVIGFLVGVATCFSILFKTARRLREETEREDREQARTRTGGEQRTPAEVSKRDEQEQNDTNGDDDSR